MPTTAVFATSENVIGWSSFPGPLADGDVISVTHTANFPQFNCTLTLAAGPAVRGWKAISLFSPSRGDFQEIFVDGSQRTASMTVDPHVFDSGPLYLHLGKAKFLGVHTGMYFLTRVDRMLGTNTTLTWLAD